MCSSYCDWSHVFITLSKLKRIFRWLVNKKFQVKITVIYDNSIGWHDERVYNGVIEHALISQDYECQYKVDVKFTDGSGMVEYLNSEYQFAYKYHPKHLVLKDDAGPFLSFIIDVTDDRVTEKRNS